MADPATYETAVRKGKALMAAMQASPDEPALLSQPSRWNTYSDFENHGWERNNSQESNVYHSNVGIEVAEVMQKYNVSLGSTDNIAICWGHNRTTGQFPDLFDATQVIQEQLYNIHRGTIIALDINSPAEYVKGNTKRFDNTLLAPNRPVLQHWSDMTFLQWQALARNNPVVVRGFRCVIHSKIGNPTTKAIIKTVLEKRGKFETREVVPWVERYTKADVDDFLALLGSPNVSGTAFMLAQHKKELGWKTVRSITVHQFEQRILVVELVNLS